MPADLCVTAGCAERPTGTSEPRCPASAKKAIPGILRLTGQQWATLPAIVPPTTQTVPVGWCLEAWVLCSDVTRSGHFIALANGTSDALYLGHSGAALVFGVQVGGATTHGW